MADSGNGKDPVANETPYVTVDEILGIENADAANSVTLSELVSEETTVAKGNPTIAKVDPTIVMDELVVKANPGEGVSVPNINFQTKVIEHTPFVCPVYKLPSSVQEQERQARLHQHQQQQQKHVSFLAELQAVDNEEDDLDEDSNAHDLMSAVADDPELYDSYVTGKIGFEQLAETVRLRYVTPARVGGHGAEEDLDNDDDDDEDNMVHELLSSEAPPQPSARTKAKAKKRSLMPPPPSRTSTLQSTQPTPAKKPRRSAVGSGGDATSSTEASGVGGSSGSGGPAFVSFLDESLRGLVGQASLQLAKGDAPGAIRICEEVMKIQPRSHEVYESLHEAYEKLGQLDKAEQFLLLAAHLHRSDPSKWCRLAELSRSAGKYKEAAQFLTRAIRIGGSDSEILRVERAELYKLAGDQTAYLRAYLDVLKRMEMEPAQALELARELANGFYQQEDFDRAAACYEAAFQRFPDLLTDAEVNIAIDLLFRSSAADRFCRALHLFVTHYGVVLVTNTYRLVSGASLCDVESTLRSPENGPLRTEVPDALVPDLLVKLAISLVNADCKQCVTEPELTRRLLELPSAENCDLLLDVADAMAQAGMLSEARRLLEALLRPGAGCDDKAAVWLSYAQCLRDAGLLEECVTAYERTIQLAPEYHQARLALSDVQLSLGKSAEALETLRVPGLPEFLTDDPSSSATATTPARATAAAESARLALNRCLMLMNRDPPAFQAEAWQLIFGRLEPLFHQLGCATLQDSQVLFTRGRKSDNLLDRINRAFAGRAGHVNPDDLWDVYRQLVQQLHAHQQWERLDLATTWAIYHPAFSSNRRRCEQINLLALTSSFYTKSHRSVLHIAKEFCCRYQALNCGPNTLALVAGLAQCCDRVALRMASKNPGLHYPLLLLGAQGFLLTGKYRRALLALTHLRKYRQDDPMVPLLSALAFASLACQKQVANRHFFVAHASAMLSCYGQLRGAQCQEVAYNTARIMHRLGLTRHAIAGYERVLATQPDGATPEQRRRNDLSSPAAHNLLVLYRSVGNRAMVNALLRRHLVID